MKSKVRRHAFGIALLLVFLVWFSSGNAVALSPAVTLAEGGDSRMPVIVSDNAPENVRAVAEELVHYLSKISGSEFEVIEGDGGRGIALGSFGDFPHHDTVDLFEPEDPFRREEYLIRTHPEGVLLLGATEKGVEHAVWDLLYRLGYRQFFPGKTWEVVPREENLEIAVDSFEQPDFYTRRIWYGHGLWDYNRRPYQQWCARNRTVRGFGLRTSHVYQAIIRRNRDVFEENPDFLALVDGERQGDKFCISNRELREWVIDNYALPYFRDNPEADCVSLDPSDGGGWCECSECEELGSISDRALLLANEAAEAISKEFPGKYVGLLAYGQHSPPPSIEVHPNVLIKVQTAFISGGYTFDELMEGWQSQGAKNIGVGDYYSVFSWDRSRPASQRGSDLAHITESISRFYRQGARLFTCESSDLWGAIGLGHYLASRLLWDISEAERADEIIDDFLEKAFGSAREPMEGFFRLIYRFEEDDRRPLIRRDMLARMYRFLAEAYELAGDDEAVTGRLDDLLLYTRYEDLYQRYSDVSGDARQEAVEEVIRHAYRMRETMMVHARPIVRGRLSGRDRNVEDPDMEDVTDDTPFSREELDNILAEGLENTQTVDIPFEPVQFSDELVPARPLDLRDAERGNFGGAPRAQTRFYTYLDEAGEVDLVASGGHIEHYRHIASNALVELYADKHPILEEPVDYFDNIPPDGREYPLELKSGYAGLHIIEADPFRANRAIVDTAREDKPFTIYAGLDDVNRMSRFWSLYFYVPEGTEIVGGFSSGRQRGAILDGDGNEVFNFREEMDDEGYFHVQVPEGQDGRLWKFHRCMGRRALLTVPPYMARSAGELLLPRELVETDSE